MNKEQALRQAETILGTGFTYDSKKSENAGYPIYVSTMEGNNGWISDLGTRLEVNLHNGTSINVWIDDDVMCLIDAQRKFDSLKKEREDLVNDIEQATRLADDLMDYNPSKKAIMNIIAISKSKVHEYDVLINTCANLISAIKDYNYNDNMSDYLDICIKNWNDVKESRFFQEMMDKQRACRIKADNAKTRILKLKEVIK